MWYTVLSLGCLRILVNDCKVYFPVYKIISLLFPSGMDVHAQSETQSPTQVPVSTEGKAYTEVPLNSLNLQAQDTLLNTQSIGESTDHAG